MSTIEQDRYSLGRSPEEYERLRAQARVWEDATGRVLARVGLGPGASCLDAGCGPGETMRLMAGRVGPTGRVQGIDMDAAIGAMAIERLHAAGHRQCAFQPLDLSDGAPIPDAPYDLVYARLLLFHLAERVMVLGRLWDAVAPGGHLVIQDYDLAAADVVPATGSSTEMVRVITDAFTVAACDVRAGARLPGLFAQAGVGEPDGTEVCGRLERLATGCTMLERTFRSLLPAALAHGITSEREAAATLAAFSRDVAAFPDSSFLWPSMNAAWKRKEPA
jgi:SAM-dependent methyltransferase